MKNPVRQNMPEKRPDADRRPEGRDSWALSLLTLLELLDCGSEAELPQQRHLAVLHVPDRLLQRHGCGGGGGGRVRQWMTSASSSTRHSTQTPSTNGLRSVLDPDTSNHTDSTQNHVSRGRVRPAKKI